MWSTAGAAMETTPLDRRKQSPMVALSSKPVQSKSSDRIQGGRLDSQVKNSEPRQALVSQYVRIKDRHKNQYEKLLSF